MLAVESRAYLRQVLTMRGSTIALIALLLSSSHQRTPFMTDAEIAKLKAVLPGMTDRCVEILRFGGIAAIPQPVEQCFKFATAQRWTGYWRSDFEMSQFCVRLEAKCFYGEPSDMTWLSFTDDAEKISDPPIIKNAGNNRGFFAIEFVGRKTSLRGMHGHMGMAPHAILVDKVISMRRVTMPKPPNFERDYGMQWETCLQSGNCVNVGMSGGL